jgi:hypothetical protein
MPDMQIRRTSIWDRDQPAVIFVPVDRGRLARRANYRTESRRMVRRRIGNPYHRPTSTMKFPAAMVVAHPVAGSGMKPREMRG